MNRTILNRIILNRIVAVLFLVACSIAPAFGQADVEQQKIEYLIHSIETLQNATFIRNGKEYDAQHAADHLRLKLRFGGSRIKTADDFITYCATESSMSGEKYQIKFQDGRFVESATFLRDKLHNYPAEDKPAA